jgi:hypothetical protein
MLPLHINAISAKRIFAGMLLVFVAAVAATASPTSPSASGDQFGDSISPGFFNPPPRVQPVNTILPSRFAHARHSYAWRMHNGKRELIAFSTPIQHVVVIYMENRTPENLFGAFYAVTNPTTGNTFGHYLIVIDPASLTPPLLPTPLNYSGDPDHSHEAFVRDVQTPWPSPTASKSGYWYVPTPSPILPPPVANYITLIEKFAYANQVLQSNDGPSFISHQYLITGQSGGLSDSSITPYGMVDNPLPLQHGHGTCFSTGQSVATVNMYSPYPGAPGPSVSPCNDYPAIVDYMASAAPTTPPYYQWQYVAHAQNSIWAGPMAIKHLYNYYVSGVALQYQPFAVDPDAENFVLNVTNSTSPAPSPARPFAELTFLTPCGRESDHPNGDSVDNGPQWLAYVINAIEASPYWPNTAIIVTWDDWGGFYDNYAASPWPYHPIPNPYGTPTGNPQDPNEWGFRVPLMVISPWVTRQGYISETLRSQGAILNFIEQTFALGNNVLNGDDFNNGTDDLGDMFNFLRITPTLPPVLLPSSFTPMNNDMCPTS